MPEVLPCPRLESEVHHLVRLGAQGFVVFRGLGFRGLGV